MRLVNLYQLYDTKAEKVNGPIIAESKDAVAIRTFHDILRDKRTQPAQYPDDFNLIYLGYQDEETGTIEPVKGLHIVATGSGWAAEQRDHAETDLRNARHGPPEGQQTQQ